MLASIYLPYRFSFKNFPEYRFTSTQKVLIHLSNNLVTTLSYCTQWKRSEAFFLCICWFFFLLNTCIPHWTRHDSSLLLLANSRLKRIFLVLPFLVILTRLLPISLTLTRLPRTRMLQRTLRLTRLHRFLRRTYHFFLRRLIRILFFLYFNLSFTLLIFLHFLFLLKYHFRPNLRSPHHLLLIRTRHRLPKRFIFLYFLRTKILILRLNLRIRFRPKKYFLLIFTRRRFPRKRTYLFPV